VVSRGAEPVEIRAFRGTRRASVYREHALSEKDFARILAAGAARRLPLLASLDQYLPHQLDKANAQRLADEITDVRMSGELPELDHDLTAIAEVARWCAHAADRSWVEIEGP
jgi:hypothetical protein